jgi:hypothetical protein
LISTMTAPLAPQNGEGGFRDGVNSGVLLHEVAEQAEPGAAQGVGFQAGGVVGGGVASRGGGGGVAGVGPGHDVEGGREVGDVAGHRADSVERERERDDAAAAVEPEGGLEAGDAVGRSGAADGAAGVGAESEGGETRRDARTGAAARTAGGAIEDVGIEDLSAEGAEGGAARELAEVGFRDDHTTGGAEAAGLLGVLRRIGIAERVETAGGREVDGVDVVLEQNRNAMEWPARAPGFALEVEGARFHERLGIERDERTQFRAGFFVGVDAGEEERRELFGRECARVHGRLQLADGGVGQRHRGGAGGQRQGADEGEKEAGHGEGRSRTRGAQLNSASMSSQK